MATVRGPCASACSASARRPRAAACWRTPNQCDALRSTSKSVPCAPTPPAPQIAATARGATDHVLAQYRDAECPLNRIFVPVNELKPDHYDLPGPKGLTLAATCLEGAGTCQTNVVALLAVHRATLTAFARCGRARLQSTRCWRWGVRRRTTCAPQRRPAPPACTNDSTRRSDSCARAEKLRPRPRWAERQCSGVSHGDLGSIADGLTAAPPTVVTDAAPFTLEGLPYVAVRSLDDCRRTHR
jgi:hypothetical protein